jgi:hypothetical protein
MKRQIKHVGITFPVHYLEASTPENSESYFPPGISHRDKRHMCCARSHNRAVHYASQDISTQFSVIVEDDVGFHKTEFERTIKELAGRWTEVEALNRHAVALGWIPEHNYKDYYNYINDNNIKLKSTNQCFKIIYYSTKKSMIN